MHITSLLWSLSVYYTLHCAKMMLNFIVAIYYPSWIRKEVLGQYIAAILNPTLSVQGVSVRLSYQLVQ